MSDVAEPAHVRSGPPSRGAQPQGRPARPEELPATNRGELALFVRRVRDLVTRPAVTCAEGTTAAEAARLMTERGVGSLVVLGEDGRALGVVTDQDLRTRVLARDRPPTTEVAAIMSAPLVSIEAGRLAFDALLEMTRRNLHHLGVVEESRVVGVVSSHDFMLLQGSHPVGLARAIEGQASVDGLAALAARLPTLVRQLLTDGAGPVEIGRIVAELNDRLVKRVTRLVESALDVDGHGRPPVPYAWLAAGSEGRREQTLRTDQDNGLVYEDPVEDVRAAAAAYFGRFADGVATALVRVGFPVCAGGFMASNPQWCQPASVWREYFRGWLETPQPERVLKACIYFDLRPIAGDERLGQALWQWVCERAPAQTLFLRHMARAAAEQDPPLGLFGRFAVERSGPHKSAIDLKGRGVFPMTQAMRVYALALGIAETNTVDRLVEAGSRGVFSAAEVEELRGAYEVIFRLRLGHQLARVEAGEPPDNFVNPGQLGKADRLLLREAFKSLGWLRRAVEERFQTRAVVA
jgi:CBS domain-containing protein